MFRFMMMIYEMLLYIIFALSWDLTLTDCQGLYKLWGNMFIYNTYYNNIKIAMNYFLKIKI